MKYGIVLGNPVVSLHRLGPQNTLASISQQSESDGFSTDTENDNNDEGMPDVTTDVETASGQQSPNSPVSSNTSLELGSPIHPHHPVAELTFSVPVLQVRFVAATHILTLISIINSSRWELPLLHQRRESDTLRVNIFL
jgi:hypothetical protein